MERTVRIKDGSVIMAHLMSESVKDSLPESLDLSRCDSLSIAPSILKAGKDSLPGYETLTEFRSGEHGFLLLSTDITHEIWSTEEPLDLLLPAENFLVTDNGRTFPVAQLALHAGGGKVMVHFRESGRTDSRYAEKSTIFIERLESKELDTHDSLIALDGAPLPGQHSVREEIRNGISQFFLDGSPIPGIPLIIRKEDMREEDVSGEWLMADGELIDGISDVRSFDIEGMPWLRIASRKGTLLIKSPDLTIIHKDSFHPMETENLIIRDKSGKSLTDTLKTLSVSNEDGVIWFFYTTMTGNTGLLSGDDITILTPESAEYLDPSSHIAFMKDTVIQNAGKILKLECGDQGTFFKLIYDNGLSSIYRADEIEVLRLDKDERIASSGIRLSAEGTDIWDIREARRIEAEGKNFILIKASTGIIRIWKEEDTEMELDASSDTRISGKLRSPLSFVAESSVLARTIKGEAGKRIQSSLPLIIPFSPDTAEVKTAEKVIGNSLAVVETPASAETVLNAAANLLLNGESVEIVTEDPDIGRLLSESGLIGYAAIFKEGKPVHPEEGASTARCLHDRTKMEEKAKAVLEDLLVTEAKEDELRENSRERETLLEKKAEAEKTASLCDDDRRSFLIKASELEEIIERVEGFDRTLPFSFVREMLRKGIGKRSFWKKDKDDLLASLDLLLAERKLIENRNTDTELRIFLQRHKAGKNREFMEELSITMLVEALYERTRDIKPIGLADEDIMLRSALIRKKFPLVVADRTGSLKKTLFDTVIVDKRLGLKGLAEALAEAKNAVLFRQNI